MSLKKPRIHITGISNIDYKSKIDIEKIFNNFNNYTIKPDKNNEPVDPTQVVVYKSPRPRKPNMYNVSLKDAMQQDGESLMYANTYRLRKELRLKRLEQNVNKKIGKNQLPKINNKNQTIDVNQIKTEQNKQSDEQRLKTLRKDIHDKLYPHKDFKNIFVTWQKNYLKNNELSEFDLHKKIKTALKKYKQKVILDRIDKQLEEIYYDYDKSNKDAFNKYLEQKIYDNPSKIIDKFYCVVWNKLFRADFLKQRQYTIPQRSPHEDVFFHYATFAFAESISFFNGSAYHYLYREQSISHMNHDWGMEHIKVFSLIYDFYKKKLFFSVLLYLSYLLFVLLY